VGDPVDAPLRDELFDDEDPPSADPPAGGWDEDERRFEAIHRYNWREEFVDDFLAEHGVGALVARMRASDAGHLGK
jgi:hypothetical protein